MMDIMKNAMPVLAVISALTGLTVEALKKIFTELKLEYKSNVLAAIVSVIITLAYCGGYVVLAGESITAPLVVNAIVLMFLSWLTAMLGYDKIKQTLS